MSRKNRRSLERRIRNREKVAALLDTPDDAVRDRFGKDVTFTAKGGLVLSYKWDSDTVVHDLDPDDPTSGLRAKAALLRALAERSLRDMH